MLCPSIVYRENVSQIATLLEFCDCPLLRFDPLFTFLPLFCRPQAEDPSPVRNRHAVVTGLFRVFQYALAALCVSRPPESPAAFRRRYGIIEVFRRASFRLFVENSLDVPYQGPVFGCHEGEGISGFSFSFGSTSFCRFSNCP
jgi:hypothetical protein